MNQVVTVFTDGGSRGNPGKAASGVVIENLAGKERLFCGKYLGIATNNVAEYTAVELAYETIIQELKEGANTVEIELFADSLLVVKQLSGEYKIKNSNLKIISSRIKQLEAKFAKVTYQHIPREQNTLADREVNRVLDEN